MNYSEFCKLDRADVAYLFVLCKMRLFSLTLTKVSLSRSKNRNGRLISNFTAHFYDKSGNFHPQRFRLYDEQYLWLLGHFSNDFGDIPLEDLSPDELKLNKEG